MRQLTKITACFTLMLSVGLVSQTQAQNQGGGQTGGGQTGGGQIGGGGQAIDNGTGPVSDTGTGSVAGDPNASFQQVGQDLSGAFDANEQTFTNQRNEGGFVGADSEAAGSVFGVGVQGQQTLGGLDGLFRALGGLNQSAGNVRNTRRVIRAPMRLGFTVSRPSDETVVNRYEGRLTQLPLFTENPNIAASLENRVLTLTGTVSDERQRKMAERLAMLEPGISKVNNQLAVIDLSRD